MLDQRQLPAVVFMQLHRWQEVAEAISSMAVRGAPAIGIAAWGLFWLHAPVMTSPLPSEACVHHGQPPSIHGVRRSS